MSEETHKAKWTGVDPLTVLGIGDFFPGEELPVTHEQAEYLKGIHREEMLIDGEPSYVEPKEQVEISGKVPASKKSALKETVKKEVNEGDLPPQEAEIVVKSNLKKGGK